MKKSFIVLISLCYVRLVYLCVEFMSGMLFACGGWSGRSRSPQILNSAESFDPRVGKWWNVPLMLTGRCAVAGVFLNNEIYAIGIVVY